MKKAALFALSLLLCLTFMAGTASASSSLNDIVDELVGTPYKWAGTTEKGFDCSGFTMFVMGKLGVDLPHSSKSQSKEGEKVAKSDLQAGDLVFFNTDGKSISHVGIYLGDGKFAHAATNNGVTINKLSDSYYANRYVTARRVL